MAKALHEVTPEEFEAQLPGHFLRGLEGASPQQSEQRWARKSELQHEKWTYRPGAFFLGYRGDSVVGRVDDRHILLVAGSRAGKGVSVITPNCLLWPGSMLAIDPKGEIARLTAGWRAKSQRVVILDPFNASKRNSQDGFNPLDEVDLAAPDAADQAALIADGLIVYDGKGDSHWTDSARQLVHAVILLVLLTEPPPRRHLGTVRDFLTLNDPALRQPPAQAGKKAPELDLALFHALVACESADHPDLGDLVSGIGKSMSAVPEKERGSIRSSAVTQTAFLDSAAIKATLRRSTFRLRDLKRGVNGKRVTVYLCLPAKFMGTHNRWLRVVINMALAAMEDDSIAPPDPPVLMVLEEFNVLGHMASIATAAGEIAGFGVRLLTVLQDLTQLKRHYGETWETFIGNAGLFLAFGNSDVTTLDYISKRLGTVTIPVVTQNAVSVESARGGASGANLTMQKEALLPPHEAELAFARERGRMLVQFPGMRPMIVQRVIAHEDSNFRAKLGLG